jgi:hypothetical protein
VLSRLAGRTVTSPVAFLAAGVFDVSYFFALFAWQTLRRRLGGGRPR